MAPRSRCSVPAACCAKKSAATPEITPYTERQQPSFYQRKLPETCVAFASFEGKKIFKSALEHHGLKSFYNLIEQHHTQTEPAFCGVSTLVLVLNALAVDPGQHWKGPWRWYEEKMLNCCVDLEEIKQTGITLQDFQCLSFCQGLSVDLHYCDETSSLDQFREAVERACLEKEVPGDENDDPSGGATTEKGKSDGKDGKNILECLVVSYSRKVLNQTGDGHFSPLAAYDKETDSVLILDTARFKYGAHWTKLPLIYEAMKPIDRTTGKSRGYALLSFVPEPTSKLTMQPASILFRSMMNQNQKRKRYKEYIQAIRRENYQYRQGEDIPYDVVRSYWYGGGNRPSSVWEIIVPTRVRTEEEKEMLRKMRLLLVDLHHATIGNSETNNDAPTKDNSDDNDNDNNKISNNTTKCSSSSSCRTCDTYNPSTNHTVSVSAEETLYIIYLATLSEERRHDFVMTFESPETMDVVRKQIIKEADMIASAIEVSDQLTYL